MKFLLLCTLVAVGCSQPVNISEADLSHWNLWKMEHKKEYGSYTEEQERMKVFLSSVQLVREHNEKYDQGEATFTMAVNKFADMTTDEFLERMTGLRVPEGYVRSGDTFEIEDNLELPKSVDWRKKGAVTPVKDQGQCGSCWAFSATGSLEGQYYLKNKQLLSLSEQNLVDCSGPQGNQGCDGGLMNYAFQYVKDNNGIDTEKSYPYKAKDGKCQYNATNKGTGCSGYVDLPSGSESALQKAVYKKGPISVAIHASANFQHYHKGYYVDKTCSASKLNHGVLCVGYGTYGGKAYWIVKNSWGTNWGMNGYIMMARNHKNMCGIATMASHPKL